MEDDIKSEPEDEFDSAEEGVSGIFEVCKINPAHSRVGRGNIMLRHSVPHFPPSSGGVAC